MTDEPDNMVLVLLRRLDQRTERIAEDLHELQVRMTGIEDGLTGVNRCIGRLEQRVERIERRLDLVDVQH